MVSPDFDGALPCCEECQHLRQHRCLTVVLEVEQVTDSIDQSAFHVAEIFLEPGDFFIRHYRTPLRFATYKQHGTADARQDMFVVIASAEALEIVKQGIEEGRVKLPQAPRKE